MDPWYLLIFSKILRRPSEDEEIVPQPQAGMAFLFMGGFITQIIRKVVKGGRCKANAAGIRTLNFINIWDFVYSLDGTFRGLGGPMSSSKMDKLGCFDKTMLKSRFKGREIDIFFGIMESSTRITGNECIVHQQLPLARKYRRLTAHLRPFDPSSPATHLYEIFLIFVRAFTSHGLFPLKYIRRAGAKVAFRRYQESCSASHDPRAWYKLPFISHYDALEIALGIDEAFSSLSDHEIRFLMLLELVDILEAKTSTPIVTK